MRFLKNTKTEAPWHLQRVFVDRLWKALQLPIEFYEKQKNELDKLAEAFGCEVLIMETEYNVTKLDGSDFERTEREGSLKDGIKALMELLTN